MAKVNYKKISAELLSISTQNKTYENNRSSINNTIDIVEHYKIDIDKLIPYRKQARREFGEKEIKGLADSIREHGIRQPLTVIPSALDHLKYEVVSGERRLRAARILGLVKIPCILISNEYDAEEIALIENIQREDLHPLELGKAFLNILDSRNGLNQRELANKLGISEKLVSDYIQYTKLPFEVKNKLISENIRNRDLMRKLIKSSSPMNLFEKANYSNNIAVSILRISLENNKFNIQSKAIRALSETNKCELKHLLSELIKTI